MAPELEQHSEAPGKHDFFNHAVVSFVRTLLLANFIGEYSVTGSPSKPDDNEHEVNTAEAEESGIERRFPEDSFKDDSPLNFSLPPELYGVQYGARSTNNMSPALVNMSIALPDRSEKIQITVRSSSPPVFAYSVSDLSHTRSPPKSKFTKFASPSSTYPRPSSTLASISSTTTKRSMISLPLPISPVSEANLNSTSSPTLIPRRRLAFIWSVFESSLGLLGTAPTPHLVCFLAYRYSSPLARTFKTKARLMVLRMDVQHLRSMTSTLHRHLSISFPKLRTPRLKR